ncbi:MAG: hypothetical protein VX768_10425 [Planctomycetota bacterium]|nr:hypothetical protein [Planctomycetota bacterium]
MPYELDSEDATMPLEMNDTVSAGSSVFLHLVKTGNPQPKSITLMTGQHAAGYRASTGLPQSAMTMVLSEKTIPKDSLRRQLLF